MKHSFPDMMPMGLIDNMIFYQTTRFVKTADRHKLYILRNFL